MDSVGWTRQSTSVPTGATPEAQKKELETLEWMVKNKILPRQYSSPELLKDRVKVLTANLAPPVPTIPQETKVLYREAINAAGEEKEIKQIEWVLEHKLEISNRTPEQLKARLELLEAREYTRAEFLKKHPGSTVQEIPFGSGIGAKMIPSGFPIKR